LTPQKRKRLTSAALAGVIAAGAFTFVIVSGRGGGAAAGPVGGPAVAQTVEIIVALRDIPQAGKITPDDLTSIQEPINLVSDSDFRKADSAKVLDHFAAVTIPARTPIVATMLAPSADLANTVAAKEPPLQLKCDGDVAVSVPFDESTGAGGYVQPGQYLSILMQLPDGSVRYGFKNVYVLRVGSRSQGSGTGAGATLLMLELSATKAAVMTYLVGTKGATGTIVRYVITRNDHETIVCGPPANAPPVDSGNWTRFLDP
jgi:Flp pilus assembly protein CpaB